MVGGTSMYCEKENPSDGWLNNKQWGIIEELSKTI